jgi:uncharacterized protein YndB with AHSA1/START domain
VARLRMMEHFDAPPEQIYELGTDFKRYPEWNVNYVEVKEITGPIERVGTRIHAIERILGRDIDSWYEIVEVEPVRLLKMTGSSAQGGTSTLTYRLTPAEDGGADVETVLEYELPLGVFGQLADKLFLERTMQRNVRHSYENFRALVEAKAPVLT